VAGGSKEKIPSREGVGVGFCTGNVFLGWVLVCLFVSGFYQSIVPYLPTANFIEIGCMLHVAGRVSHAGRAGRAGLAGRASRAGLAGRAGRKISETLKPETLKP